MALILLALSLSFQVMGNLNLVPRVLFPGFEGGAGKGPVIGWSHDHQTPRICGCTKLAYDRTINKTSEMAGRPEFLSGSDFP